MDRVKFEVWYALNKCPLDRYRGFFCTALEISEMLFPRLILDVDGLA